MTREASKYCYVHRIDIEKLRILFTRTGSFIAQKYIYCTQSYWVTKDDMLDKNNGSLILIKGCEFY